MWKIKIGILSALLTLAMTGCSTTNNAKVETSPNPNTKTNAVDYNAKVRNDTVNMGYDIKKGADNLGTDIKDGINRTGEMVKDGANNTGEMVRKGINNTENIIGDGINDIGNDVMNDGEAWQDRTGMNPDGSNLGVVSPSPTPQQR